MAISNSAAKRSESGLGPAFTTFGKRISRICEDSRAYAAALQRVIEFGGEFDVVAVSRTAEEALAAVERLAPDLVTMDVELPGMSGLEAVERIMSVAPLPILVLSGHVDPGSQASAAALAAGALEALPKCSVDLLHPGGEGASAFRRRLATLSKTRVIRHPVLRRARDPLTRVITVGVLIDQITINETTFLRDRRQLDSIDWHDLHARAVAGGSPVVRIWSAACATGEEPYSLALLASEAFASTAPPVSILATDVSSSALASAAAGHYRARAVQAVEEPLRHCYFESAGSSYTAIPALRSLVRLAPHNLVADPFPPLGEAPYHLLLCRNVLIYFAGDTCGRVVAGLERALAPGGRLMLGAADALCVLDRAAGELHRGPPRSARPPIRPRERARRPLRAATPDSKACSTDELMDPAVQYLHGLDALDSGNPVAAVSSLRRVLYLDPGFELAAFALGRAHEEAGEPDAARRRYLQAIRMLGERPEPGERLAGRIDASTVIDACEARLAALIGGGASRSSAAMTTKDGPR